MDVVSAAIGFGASLAGVCRVEDLKSSPSHALRLGSSPRAGEDPWPENARSVIVLGLAHPEDMPELDWWTRKSGTGNTPGNEELIRIVSRLARWILEETGRECFPIPYHLERGGLFMKDAAALAGMGCIGRNNLLVTPEYGPRVRLRLLLTAADLSPTPGRPFDPCARCSMPCRTACPQGAFSGDPAARNAGYSVALCTIQMERDLAHAEEFPVVGSSETARRVKYCRRCELACPVGKTSS
ncbi:epoxyqueuosine reductase [Desulfacinum infernum DSM 9756]|uniref:Epoxyqueuosine reductase n=1 Tax=Desulfacinum infernum DSM 9756 TaxID=1121391 RepID=A0A1M5HUG5_9BACT|nr:epoxyqueuosine reductase [Desulfacinum infernum DSM 9756]